MMRVGIMRVGMGDRLVGMDMTMAGTGFRRWIVVVVVVGIVNVLMVMRQRLVGV